ncbi:MAG: hypothetical protein ABIP51_13035 [Bacteroidia bacterium]
MRYIFLIISMIVFGFTGYSQKSSDLSFLKDTVRIPKENKVLDSEYLITTLKNGSTVQLIKSSNNKFYLRLCTTENLYFGKTDLMEIRSGSKNFYAKETTNYEIGKNSGYYIIEIYKNYIATLRDEGITAYAFGKAVTSFTKQDCNQVKQMAKVFYENFWAKK